MEPLKGGILAGKVPDKAQKIWDKLIPEEVLQTGH